MRKRDIIALIILIFLAGYLLIRFGVSEGFNPFVRKLNLKVSARVACWDIGIYKYCHYARDMGAEVVSSTPLFSFQPLGLIQNPAEISVDVRVRYPSGTEKMQHQETKFYESGWYDFYFSFPADEEGVYRWKVRVCGSVYGTWQCDERSGTWSI